MSSVGDDLASFARIKSDIGLVVGIIIAVIFTIIAVYSIAHGQYKGGFIMLAIGIVVGLLSWLSYYLTHKYKGYAEVVGAENLFRAL